MEPIIIIPPNLKSDLFRFHGRLLGISKAIVLLNNIGTRQIDLVPPNEASRLYYQPVLTIDIRPDLTEELCAKYSIITSGSHFLTGGIKANHRSIEFWLNPLEIVYPEPAYSESVRDILKTAPSGSILLGESAISQVDRISTRNDDYTSGFRDFIEESLWALIKLSQLEGGLCGEDIQSYFSREAPSAEYASSGSEQFRFKNPFNPRSRPITKKHLKPRIEQRGYLPPEVKPRLYFDTIVNQGSLKIVILYLGPHPRTGSQVDVRDIILPAE